MQTRRSQFQHPTLKTNLAGQILSQPADFLRREINQQALGNDQDLPRALTNAQTVRRER